MSRKLSVFLITIILITAVGCNTLENDAPSAESSLSSPSSSSSVPNNSPIMSGSSASSYYIPLEDHFESITHIVKAKYINTTQNYDLFYHNFEVVQCLRGTPTEETIKVGFIPTDYSIIGSNKTFSTKDLPYSTGSEYLLLLNRSSSVYDDGHEYSAVNDSLLIPLNGDGSINVNGAMMYGTKLNEHLDTKDTADAFNEGTFVDYLIKQIENNPLINESFYIKSTDPETVVPSSDYVLKITVDTFIMDSYSKDRSTYNCKIEHIYKGNIQKDEITVVFPSNSVEINKTYIVALFDMESQALFVMSSKNSVFSVDMSDEIENMLK